MGVQADRLLRQNCMFLGDAPVNIFVGNLPYSSSEEQLEELFGRYGKVDSVRIISDRDTRRSRGFAFVEMPDENEAKSAIEALNGTNVGGRDIKVNEARPKEESAPRRSRNRYR